MGDLVEFLKSHEEAFLLKAPGRLTLTIFYSRARLASLYSDFRFQRTTNIDGYQANCAAWQRALSAAAQAGLIPSAAQTNDRYVLHTNDALLSALQTAELGRPLALGAAVEDGVQQKQFMPVKEFFTAKSSIYTKSWVPSPWQIAGWGLRQLGLAGGESRGEDRLVKGDFVIVANIEAAAKAVLDHVLSISTSNTSGIFSRELFAQTFSPVLGGQPLSSSDSKVLLTHLARDRQAISYSPATGTIKFKPASSTTLQPITEEDISIASLRTLLASLQPQIDALTERSSTLDKKAREAVSKKQPIVAKTALVQKKAVEAAIQQHSATLLQLEDVYAKIEQAADQVEIVSVMEAAGKTLKSLNAQTGGVEKVQDVMENLRESMLDADEIGTALNENAMSAIDDGEVEDELEAMEKAEREKREAAEKQLNEVREQKERAEREKKEADEVEALSQRLAELDSLGAKPADVGSPKIAQMEGPGN